MPRSLSEREQDPPGYPLDLLLPPPSLGGLQSRRQVAPAGPQQATRGSRLPSAAEGDKPGQALCSRTVTGRCRPRRSSQKNPPPITLPSDSSGVRDHDHTAEHRGITGSEALSGQNPRTQSVGPRALTSRPRPLQTTHAHKEHTEAYAAQYCCIISYSKAQEYGQGTSVAQR